MTTHCPITSHVLDTALGKPAAGIPVLLERDLGEGKFIKQGSGTTNDDGRIPKGGWSLESNASFPAGIYRVTFNVKEYSKSNGSKSFYPYVPIVFEIEDPTQHFHIPCLLSPYGFTTYRGS